MKDKVILITGCSSGIGLYLAEALTKRGYTVIASARKQKDVENLNQKGFRSLLLDISDSISIKNACKYISQEMDGKIFALINNAGFGQPGAVEDLSRDALREQFETNLFGTVELTNSILPFMFNQGFGKIIQISSVLGFVAMPLRGAYVASKYALEGISDTMRVELKNKNISVSLIQPGPIISRFRQNSLLMFEKHTPNEESRFQPQYEKFRERLTKDGPVVPFTLGPDAILNKVIHALENKRPKSHYLVTFPTYLFALLKWLLPTRALDYILEKSSNSECK